MRTVLSSTAALRRGPSGPLSKVTRQAAIAVARTIIPSSPPCHPTISFKVSSPSSLPYGLRWSSSNSRWKQRQGNDFYARQAKVQGLKSRAAFKLLELDSKHKLFKKGQMVVDLGYAPGSWSQVAMERTKPTGRVIGIDIIPAQPPKGVSTIQGNFLSPGVQNLVKEYLSEIAQRRREDRAAERRAKAEAAAARAIAREGEEETEQSTTSSSSSSDGTTLDHENKDDDHGISEGIGKIVLEDRPSYIDTERHDSVEHHQSQEETQGRLVDVVLSDMSAPWPQTSGNHSKTLSNPYSYFRMMNTSGMSFRDHAGSMDLCLAALRFASDTLRSGGHFVCKFYQGAEDKQLELRLRKMFGKVHREKPDSSRSESKESYFVALRRRSDVSFADTEMMLPASGGGEEGEA